MISHEGPALAETEAVDYDLKTFSNEEFGELMAKKLATLDDPDISADDYCVGMNRFVAALGKRLTINNMAELDAAMLSDKPLII